MAAYEVSWDESSALLTTRTRSPIELAEVFRFKRVLAKTLARVPTLSSFLWLSSAVGYHPLADPSAHQELRSVVPVTLAAHGVRTSLLDLHEGLEVAVSRTRGVLCRAIAHVHHDAAKMRILDERFGRPNERYFADEALAMEWLALQ